jgi:DNA-binding FadR family transcriptional regulator
MQYYEEATDHPIYSGVEGSERWKQERHNLIDAILRGDPGLARFEAQRHHEDILRRLAQ